MPHLLSSKESGVFSSIIAKAPATLSRDKFLTSIESSNSSRVSGTRPIRSPQERWEETQIINPMQLLGRFWKLQKEVHEATVPSLSPPRPTMETHENDLIV